MAEVRALHINDAMMIAAVHAIQELAREPILESILQVYPNSDNLTFGHDYILPKPSDPRLLERVSLAVSKAAIASRVATFALEQFELNITGTSEYKDLSDSDVVIVTAGVPRKPDPLFVGVPVKIGRNGVEEIIEVPLSESEQAAFNHSVAEVIRLNEAVDKL